MSNKVWIDIKKEIELDKYLKPIGTEESDCGEVYIHCDGIAAWIGTVDSYEEAKKLIAPNNILNVMEENLSCDELECIEFLMSPGARYIFYDEVYYVADNEEDCEEEDI